MNGELTKKCEQIRKKLIEVVSNKKMLHSIVISNKLGITPVEAFLENYQI
mgnify:CR=1 FL=1